MAMSLTNALHRILRPDTTAYARCLTAQADTAGADTDPSVTRNTTR
jgi:hypothetical protein